MGCWALFGHKKICNGRDENLLYLLVARTQKLIKIPTGVILKVYL
jgi:hypothetical protein